jgi:hypothetical protein
MSIEVGTVAKSVSFRYNVGTEEGQPQHITGERVAVFAKNPGAEGDPKEVKNPPNDGAVALAFPLDFNGEVYIELHGSDAGEDSATLAIGDAPAGVPDEEVEGDPPPEAAQLPA